MVEENQELFTTLYAQRLFFLVITAPSGISFEPISRADSRLLVESRLRVLRRTGSSQEFEKLQLIHKQTF